MKMLEWLYWLQHPEWRYWSQVVSLDGRPPPAAPRCRYGFKLLDEQRAALLAEGYINDDTTLTAKGLARIKR